MSSSAASEIPGLLWGGGAKFKEMGSCGHCLGAVWGEPWPAKNSLQRRFTGKSFSKAACTSGPVSVPW